MKKFIRAAGIRALRTILQTIISMVTVGQAFSEINWAAVLSVSATAGFVSICTSILSGLPEVEDSP